MPQEPDRQQNLAENGDPHMPADTASSMQEVQQDLLACMAQTYFETDLNGRLTRFNDYVCRFHGRTSDELRSMSYRDFIPTDQATVVAEAFQRVFQTGLPSPILEYDVVRKDGSVVTAQTVVALRRDASGTPIGFCGISRDATASKQTQRALHDSEESHRAILEAAPYSIAIMRRSDWTYFLVNQVFCQRTGYSKEEAIGRTSSELNLYKNPRDRERFIETFHRDGQVDRLEITFQSKEGRPLENLVAARPMRFKGEDCILSISTNISDIKNAQRALQESEASYRTILQAAPYSITILRMSDGRYVEVNEAFCHRLGYRPEESIGRTANELNLFVNSADLKRLMEVFGKQGRVDNMEIAFRTRNGTITTSLVSARPIQYKGEACILFITSNIDALKETQRALEESEARFRAVFETAADPIFLNDLQTGRFIDVNQAACRHLGYDKADFLDISIADISDPPCAYPVTDSCQRPAGGNPMFFETLHVRRDGSKAIVEVSSQVMVHKGKKTLLSIARDVTRRKTAEQELARYRENLEKMVVERTRELETAQNELVKREKLAVLGQLTATVSHELRNPLGVIRSSNFYLQRRLKTEDEKAKKHFQRIEDQITMCEAIVADLLEYTRGRQASIVKQEISPWLEQVVEQVEEQEGIPIHLEVTRALPPVPHDPEKMRRVLINLLLNAVQAVNSRKEATVTKDLTYEPRICVKTSMRDGQLVIDVSDNGIGMDVETRRRAFEPLFTTRARGTGIGLANVKKIIEEHDGRIMLESEPGQGTRISLLLPHASGH